MKRFFRFVVIFVCALTLATLFTACDNESKEQAINKVNGAIEAVNDSGAVDASFKLGTKLSGVSVTYNGQMQLSIDEAGAVLSRQSMNVFGVLTDTYFVDGYVCSISDDGFGGFNYNVSQMDIREFLGTDSTNIFEPINIEDVKEWSKSKKDGLTTYAFEVENAQSLGLASGVIPGLEQASDFSVSLQITLNSSDALHSYKCVVSFVNAGKPTTVTIDMTIVATGDAVTIAVSSEVYTAIDAHIGSQLPDIDEGDEGDEANNLPKTI